MKQINYRMGLLLAGTILILMATTSSCTTYGKSCDGNKRMLTAGPGYTKFRK